MYARKHQIQLLFCLEAELERHDERRVHLREHHPLRQGMRNLVPGHNVLLPDRLERVDTRRVSLSNLHDLRR